jgi:hypothetical protein
VNSLTSASLVQVPEAPTADRRAEPFLVHLKGFCRFA